jgi:hypothetical protein
MRCSSLLLGVLLAAASGSLTAAPAEAQTPPAAATTDTIYEVRLRDGSVLYGRIIEQSADRIVLRTAADLRVEVPRAQIEQLRVTSGVAHGGVYWPEDPNKTRLFFTSTARPLDRGEGYVSSFMLVLPFAAYGVTDRLTIAGGTPLIGEFFGRVWYLAPKYTLMQRPNMSFALGGLGFIHAGKTDEGSVGIVYGAGTFGSTDRALTVGTGWGYATAIGSRSGITSDPVVMLGGETRVSRRIKLITENWLYFGGGESGGILTGGVRFIGDRLSADLGVGGLAADGESYCCFPLVNFVYNFGQRR